MTEALGTHLGELARIAAIAVMAGVAMATARAYARRVDPGHADLLTVARRAEKALLTIVIVAAIRIALVGVEVGTFPFAGFVAHGLNIALIVALVWLVIEVMSAMEAIVLVRYAPARYIDEVGIRKARTQVTLVRRRVVAVVAVVGVGAILMTFPAVRVMGQGLVASAVLISIAAGLAAQATLTNVFAGIQLTLGNSIRVGDVARQAE